MGATKMANPYDFDEEDDEPDEPTAPGQPAAGLPREAIYQSDMTNKEAQETLKLWDRTRVDRPKAKVKSTKERQQTNPTFNRISSDIQQKRLEHRHTVRRTERTERALSAAGRSSPSLSPGSSLDPPTRLAAAHELDLAAPADECHVPVVSEPPAHCLPLNGVAYGTSVPLGLAPAVAGTQPNAQPNAQPNVQPNVQPTAQPNGQPNPLCSFIVPNSPALAAPGRACQPVAALASPTKSQLQSPPLHRPANQVSPRCPSVVSSSGVHLAEPSVSKMGAGAGQRRKKPLSQAQFLKKLASKKKYILPNLPVEYSDVSCPEDVAKAGVLLADEDGPFQSQHAAKLYRDHMQRMRHELDILGLHGGACRLFDQLDPDDQDAPSADTPSGATLSGATPSDAVLSDVTLSDATLSTDLLLLDRILDEPSLPESDDSDEELTSADDLQQRLRKRLRRKERLQSSIRRFSLLLERLRSRTQTHSVCNSRRSKLLRQVAADNSVYAARVVSTLSGKRSAPGGSVRSSLRRRQADLAVMSQRCCAFVIDGVSRLRQRCNRTSIPLANFCGEHILQSSDQQLFSACRAMVMRNGFMVTCGRATFDLTSAPGSSLSPSAGPYCDQHADFAKQQSPPGDSSVSSWLGTGENGNEAVPALCAPLQGAPLQGPPKKRAKWKHLQPQDRYRTIEMAAPVPAPSSSSLPLHLKAELPAAERIPALQPVQTAGFDEARPPSNFLQASSTLTQRAQTVAELGPTGGTVSSEAVGLSSALSAQQLANPTGLLASHSQAQVFAAAPVGAADTEPTHSVHWLASQDVSRCLQEIEQRVGFEQTGSSSNSTGKLQAVQPLTTQLQPAPVSLAMEPSSQQLYRHAPPSQSAALLSNGVYSHNGSQLLSVGHFDQQQQQQLQQPGYNGSSRPYLTTTSSVGLEDNAVGLIQTSLLGAQPYLNGTAMSTTAPIPYSMLENGGGQLNKSCAELVQPGALFTANAIQMEPTGLEPTSNGQDLLSGFDLSSLLAYQSSAMELQTQHQQLALAPMSVGPQLSGQSRAPLLSMSNVGASPLIAAASGAVGAGVPGVGVAGVSIGGAAAVAHLLQQPTQTNGSR